MPNEEWTVDIRDQTYHVSAIAGERGMVAIRVNGRMAAQPLGPNESQRIFQIGGAVYKLARAEDGTLSLDLRETAPIVVPAALPATSGATHLGSRSLVWGFIALLVAAPFVWYVMHTTYSKIAQRRVEYVLNGMSTLPDSATLGMWLRNTHHLADLRELSWASDHFDQWRREKDLYHKIDTWKVLKVAKVEGAEVQTASVEVEIDGKKLRIMVPEGKPLGWAE